LAKKNTNADASEDGQQNGPAPFAAGEAPPPEATPPPLPEVFGQTPAEPPPVSTPSNSEGQLAAVQPPIAQPVPPTASLVLSAPDPALEERLRRLEVLLTQAQESLRAAEQQRGSERVQAPPAAPSGPSMLGQARALLDVGRHLLPALPPGQAPPKPKGWLIWEMIAEVRAMFCMYLDPRYRLPWQGYVLPPVLFVAFLFSNEWLPFTQALGKLHVAWALTVPVDLILLYAMFKILGHEARRYRETAPDLPPNLRL
jgi:hypothetical protein